MHHTYLKRSRDNKYSAEICMYVCTHISVCTLCHICCTHSTVRSYVCRETGKKVQASTHEADTSSSPRVYTIWTYVHMDGRTYV